MGVFEHAAGFARESALKEEVLVELAELAPEFGVTGRLRMARAD